MSHTPHLDAERLAALMDGTLSRAERMAAERHAADCGECLQLLAAMVRTEPEPAQQGWRLRAVMKWAIPLAAAATAVALWFNLEPRALPPAPGGVRSEARRDRAPATDAAPPSQRSAPEPGSADVDAVAPPPPRSVAARQRTSKPAPQPAPREEAAGQLARDERAKEAAPPPASSPGTPLPSAAAAPTPPAAAPPLQDVATQARTAFSTARQVEPFEFEFASPDPSVRWRVRGNTISRTLDGGKSWSAPAAAFPAIVRAGTSPSAQSAWVVGSQGLIMRTVDGVTWMRGGTPGPVDFVAVRASNALEAEVTTADGRTFRTSDGGRTWTPQQGR